MIREDLARLRSKYEAMKTLRDLHERGKTDASFVEPDPKAQLAALADAFPGALREIDELPLATISSRIDALLRAERDPSAVAEWMVVQTTFHRLARGALATKRWLAKRKDPTAIDRDALRTAIEVGAIDHATDASAWIDEVHAIARPPNGRLMPLVWERVANELFVEGARPSIAELRRRAFG